MIGEGRRRKGDLIHGRLGFADLGAESRVKSLMSILPREREIVFTINRYYEYVRYFEINKLKSPKPKIRAQHYPLFLSFFLLKKPNMILVNLKTKNK